VSGRPVRRAGGTGPLSLDLCIEHGDEVATNRDETIIVAGTRRRDDAVRGGVAQLRVVQLNAGSLLEPEWDRRRHEIVSWLTELEPAVICLQETWEDLRTANTGGWVVDELPARGTGASAGRRSRRAVARPGERFGSTIAVTVADRRRELPPGSRSRRRPPASWGTSEGAAPRRDRGLDVFSAHLAAAPTDALHRVQQVLAIEEIVRAARGTKDELVPRERRSAMPPILCGDFNAEPDSDEIRFLCSLTSLEGRVASWQDAWRVAGAGGPGLTQDWRINPIAASLNVHPKRIDYVFVGDGFLRAGDAGRVLAAEVVLDEPRTGIVASDHAGLCVDIVWPGRPT
jgi:endonuclease/exonuclease/phosphatase family metal-dependent hydrolase